MNTLTKLLCIAPLGTCAQGLVSHDPQQRTVLIEQFTGVLNNNAPQANTTVQGIEDFYGGVAIVNLHTGPFAEPIGDVPDLRNEWADDLAEQFVLAFVPSGLVSRTPYNETLVLSPNTMSQATETLLDQLSPVNIGVSSSFEPISRELTVSVELYYTADDTGGTDHISVLVKEDHIIGGQADSQSEPPFIPDYDHRHVLRAYITDLWGDEVLSADPGSTVMRTYTYTLPEEFDEQQCSVVAFVGEHQADIYQVREVPAVGGSTIGLAEEALIPFDINLIQAGPSEAYLHITGSMPRTAYLSVLDALGRTIMHRAVRYGREPISTGALAAGVYTCLVQSSGRARTHRFAVQR
jgi:hypothetical protein